MIFVITNVIYGGFDAWFGILHRPNQPPLVGAYGRTPTRQSLISMIMGMIAVVLVHWGLSQSPAHLTSHRTGEALGGKHHLPSISPFPNAYAPTPPVINFHDQWCFSPVGVNNRAW